MQALQALRESNLYRLLGALLAWCAPRWRESRIYALLSHVLTKDRRDKLLRSSRESNLARLWDSLAPWATEQWKKSRIVDWFTRQKFAPDGNPGIINRMGALYLRLFSALRLEKALPGSIFLRPLIFIFAALILAPLAPTLVALGLVCASFFSLLMAAGMRGELRFSASPLDKYVALFALVYIYATLTSATLSGSLYQGLLTTVFVLFFFAITNAGMDRDSLLRLVWGMAIAGALVSLYGFYQKFFNTLSRVSWTDASMFSGATNRVYSTLENPNVLGEYLLLAIPPAAALALTGKTHKNRLIAAVIAVMMALCLMFTFSRGCYLGLLVSAGIFLVMLDRRFILLGVLAVIMAPVILPASVIHRFASIGNMSDTSTSYRVYIWMGTLNMLKQYWFSGIGPGEEAFNIVYPTFAYNAVTAPHSHNLFLQLLCDTGVCGLGLFVLLLVSFCRMMFTAIRRESSREAKTFQIAAVCSVAGFMVESMADYTFYNYRVLLLFWATLALGVLFCRMGGGKLD